MNRNIFLIIAFFLSASLHKAFGQSVFQGMLFNHADSSSIPYATVTVRQTGQSTITDTNGTFKFPLSSGVRKVTLDIKAIGIKASPTFTYPFSKTEKIYVDVLADTLGDVAIKGLSALQVVKAAVAAIPLNYADTGYFNYSFYRRYQKVNGLYVNLLEACPVVMFKILKEKKELKAQEAYSVLHLRRSNFHSNIMNEQEDNPGDLISLNPVYHLYQSSLKPSGFPNFYFYFDTSIKNNSEYVIHYLCNRYSTDHHGIGWYTGHLFAGEEYERGTLVIDKNSFAIKKFQRKSIRHIDYRYNYFYPNNRVVYHNQNYFFEFIDGDLEVQYKQLDGKWYLDKMFRQYTNEFDDAWYNKKYVITDNFEWHSGPTSHTINEKYAKGFHPVMATAIHTYEPDFWKADSFPFHYAMQDSVYKDIGKEGAIENQFSEEAKIDDSGERRH